MGHIEGRWDVASLRIPGLMGDVAGNKEVETLLGLW